MKALTEEGKIKPTSMIWYVQSKISFLVSADFLGKIQKYGRSLGDENVSGIRLKDWCHKIEWTGMKLNFAVFHDNLGVYFGMLQLLEVGFSN